MTRGGRLAVLAALYFSQGLPFGFFTIALPVVLRASGVDLRAVGATSLLLLPWALKFLWGPLVDRTRSRRAWILPLQLATVALLAALATIDPAAQVQALVVGMLLASLLASTQDVATDGLAIALLPPEERGLGNGLQVGAYRFGMIVGGSVVLALYSRLGPAVAFGTMSALLLAATVPVALSAEPPTPAGALPVTLRSIVAAARRPGIGHWLAVLCLYKAGEAAIGPMTKTFLVDAGWTLEDIGWTLGLAGSGGGLVGAMTGGLLAGAVGRRTALVTCGVAQSASIVLFVAPVVYGASPALAAAVVVVEHVASGMATAALFTRMMDHCRPGLEATDYTLQASVVVFATGLAGSSSGLLAAPLGYGPLFAACAAVSLVAAAHVAWVEER